MLDLFRWLHIIAGSVALISLWIPIFTKKGGLVHRQAGWTFAIAMGVVAIAAWIVCGLRLTDQEVSNDGAAIFLAFIGLLSVNGAVVGIRVLRTKSIVDRVSSLDIGFSLLFLIASIALAIYATPKKAILLLVFSLLGITLSVQQLRFWLKRPQTKMEWWYMHMRNMLGACIATITAFFVVNAANLGLATFSLFVWITPGIIGAIGTSVWTRYYRKKFEVRSVIAKT